MIVVTTETVPGKKISEVIGYVSGLAPMKAVGSFSDAKRLERADTDMGLAMQRIVGAASRKKADAIVGMKVECLHRADGQSFICMYGTAVKTN